MCGSLIKGPKKASKGWLNEIDSTEKGEKKKRNCRAREKWNSCCSLKFLGRLNRNKICRLFGLQKKMSLVVFKEQPEYTSNRSRMYFSDRTYILD